MSVYHAVPQNFGTLQQRGPSKRGPALNAATTAVPAHLVKRSVSAVGQDFPARRVGERVRFAGGGAEVAAITVRYHPVGEIPASSAPIVINNGLGCVVGAKNDSASEDGDEDAVADEFDELAGWSVGRAENILPMNSIRSLSREYAHNPNLVKQFHELSESFLAWRPVRGDGNCYYRAVLFAWLERAVAIGAIDSIRNFRKSLEPLISEPGVGGSARRCRNFLRKWAGIRAQCSTEQKVRELLVEIGEEFDQVRSDRAFILCLRHLIGRHLLSHGGLKITGDAFTYEAWATVTHAASLEDYCASEVFVMDREAADLVQHVCPQVLRTVVRICMVERESARCTFIDYGVGGSPVPSVANCATSVQSAKELASTSSFHGLNPEIFILLKPGHYDILIPRGERVAQLLCDGIDQIPEGSGEAGRTRGKDSPEVGQLKRHCDARWRSLIRIVYEVLGASQEVTRCLEEKLEEELNAKKRRHGSIDESLFEGQLRSVLDPLRDAYAHLTCVPEDSPFKEDSETPAGSGEVDSLQSLMPKLAALLQGGLPSASPVVPASPCGGSPIGDAAGTLSCSASSGFMTAPPAVGTQPSPAAALGVGGSGPGATMHQRRSVPVEVQVHATKPAEPPTSSATAPPPPPLLAADSASTSGRPSIATAESQAAAPTGRSLECCICMENGATAVAHCGCAYHVACLCDYTAMEGAAEVSCHLHDLPLGMGFVQKHVPGFASPIIANNPGATGTVLKTQPAPAAQPAPFAQFEPAPRQSDARPSLVTVAPSALSQAKDIGPHTRRQLEHQEQQQQQQQQQSMFQQHVKTQQVNPLLEHQWQQQQQQQRHPQKQQLESLPSALTQAKSIGPATRQMLSAITESAPSPNPFGGVSGDGKVSSGGASPWSPQMAAVPVSAVIPGSLASAVAGVSGSTASLRRAPQPPSSARVPASGNLGLSLGIPCVICFGEEGVLKTLHCGYKAHATCLREFWSAKVVALGRLTDIRCPAEVAGCSLYLGDLDLRGVVAAGDLQLAEQSIQDVDAQNRLLIDELKKQSEEYRPMFDCAICLVEHEVEGCCTLPCQHRFCFESLQYHFDIIVRERRLNKLACPADGCGYNLRSEEFIHIFQQCLSEETYDKLLEFLTRDDPHVFECRHLGCEERVFLDDGDDFVDLTCSNGHRFCGQCENGPHAHLSCEEQQERIDAAKKEDEAQKDQDEAWKGALSLGWKPCPMVCSYGGGYKAQEECDHVTCECGFEFCWDCGVDRRILLQHDNRWHKPSCRYHTRPEDVAERPRYHQNCPECKQNPVGKPCNFPPDDGYPQSFIRRRSATSRTSARRDVGARIGLVPVGPM